jgi:hypothetical protein
MMSLNRIGRFLMAGVTGLLFGCGDGPASNVSYKLPQAWDFFFYGVKDGPMLVEIDGNPKGFPADVLADSVVSAMRSAFSEPFVSFTADRAKARYPEYRMIWSLNPAFYDMNKVCLAARPTAVTEPRDRLEIRGAFCQDGRLLSAVHGWMPARDAAPDSPSWQQLISQMTRQMVGFQGG